MTWYEDYKVDLRPGEAGPWTLTVEELTAEDVALTNMQMAWTPGGSRTIPPGRYTFLRRNGRVVMSDTRAEIRDHLVPIRKATGHCLVAGLGLGMVTEAMLKRPEVESVTVLEVDGHVIDLVGSQLVERYGNRLILRQEDALAYKPKQGEVYDVAWYDIWDDLCEDNLEEMTVLHRRWGRRVGWQGSWGKELLQAIRRDNRRRGW